MAVIRSKQASTKASVTTRFVRVARRPPVAAPVSFDDYAALGITGISIGSNDLTQL